MRSPHAPLLSCSLFLTGTHGFWSSSGTHDVTIPTRSIEGLTTSHSPSADYDFEATLDDVRRRIESVTTMPTCQRLANSELLRTCRELSTSTTDGAPSDIHQALEMDKSLFAARLAVCELQQAGAPIPGQCARFLPTNVQQKQHSWSFSARRPTEPVESFPGYDQSTATDLNACRRAMFSAGGQGQGWVSYSNNMQNAVAQCYVARGEVEKDEQINLYRALMESVGPMSEIIERYGDRMRDFEASFHDLVSNVRNFDIDLHEGYQQQQQQVRQWWDDWVGSMQNNMQDLSSTIITTHDSFRQSGQEVQHGLDNIQGSVSDISRSSAQAADQVAGLSDVIEYITQIIRIEVAQGIYDVTMNLTSLNTLVANGSEDAASLTLALGDNRAHTEALTANLDSLAATTRETSQSVESLRANLGWFSDFLGGEWLESLWWATVYFSFAFAVWHQFAGWNLLSSASAAITTAIVLAYVTRTFIGFVSIGNFIANCLQAVVPATIGLW